MDARIEAKSWANQNSRISYNYSRIDIEQTRKGLYKISVYKDDRLDLELFDYQLQSIEYDYKKPEITVEEKPKKRFFNNWFK